MKKILKNKIEKKLLSILYSVEYGLKFKEIVNILKRYKKIEKSVILKALRNLKKNNIIDYIEPYYFIKTRVKTKKGKLSINRSGNGFILQNDGDIFIQKQYLASAKQNDVVEAILIKSSGLRERGRITKIIKRDVKRVMGKVYIDRVSKFLLTESKDLPEYIKIIDDDKKSKTFKIKNNDYVKAELVYENNLIKAKIIELLPQNQDYIDFIRISSEFSLPEDFPSIVLNETALLKKPNKDELKKRTDLRKEIIFTIDGESAKDLDDAISIEKKGDKYILGVHIADVSYYVKENSNCDKEAFKRGNSNYLGNYSIPMLPRQLSEDLCSLNENEDKLTKSIFMEIDNSGIRTGYYFRDSVIKSTKRLTYKDVENFIKGAVNNIKHKKVEEKLLISYELAQKLYNKRYEDGSIEFNLKESDYTVDKDGNIKEIFRKERLWSERIIEEFMLMANKTIAEFLFTKKLGGIFRTHPEPKKEKIEHLNNFLSPLGKKLPEKKKINPKRISEILDFIKERLDAPLLNRLTLRTMEKAIYSEKDLGHYALNFKHYLHFTSPIRRYSDLIVHRIISNINNSHIPYHKNGKPDTKKLKKIAYQCTKRELLAVEAERSFNDLKAAEFMSNYIGKEFIAYITGLTDFGIFAELREYPVEGMIRLQSIKKEKFKLVREEEKVVGSSTKRELRLGDRINVRIKKVNIAKKKIDLDLIL